MMIKNPPRTWTTNADGSAICDHRDLGVCTSCASKYRANLVDVFGAYYWVADIYERSELIAALAE